MLIPSNSIPLLLLQGLPPPPFRNEPISQLSARVWRYLSSFPPLHCLPLSPLLGQLDSPIRPVYILPPNYRLPPLVVLFALSLALPFCLIYEAWDALRDSLFSVCWSRCPSHSLCTAKGATTLLSHFRPPTEICARIFLTYPPVSRAVGSSSPSKPGTKFLARLCPL